MQRIFCNLEPGRSCIWSTQLRTLVDVDSLSLASQAEPCVVVEVPYEVTAELNILETLDARSEGSGNTDGAGGNAKRLSHSVIWVGIDEC